ncbi:MAG: hypothetical protein Q4D39_03960 [Coriobacteriaceae bacterium]|nr:hypothetical protein [Coriobacteriaceae bacterium]
MEPPIEPPEGCRVSILDPTGNITALVEGDVAVEQQPAFAAQVMAEHPEVEQVGFVKILPAESSIQAELRMAGGEFCGNASMCAAALWAERMGCADARKQAVRLRVSGAASPVEVHVAPQGEGRFSTGVRMPRAQRVVPRALSFEGAAGVVPVVEFEGIIHAVIDRSSQLFALRDDSVMAEAAVRTWCEEQGASCMGLMFVEGAAPNLCLTPLVYVPKGGTLFWESSCASGSAAAGIAFAERACKPVSLSFAEPGGTIHVESDGVRGDTWLFGSVRMA